MFLTLIHFLSLTLIFNFTDIEQKNIKLPAYGALPMGQYQRGVHFGAASLKRGEESSKFPVAIFSYTIFKQFFNISAAQNKNYF